jgi:hypothetical protein
VGGEGPKIGKYTQKFREINQKKKRTFFSFFLSFQKFLNPSFLSRRKSGGKETKLGQWRGCRGGRDTRLNKQGDKTYIYTGGESKRESKEEDKMEKKKKKKKQEEEEMKRKIEGGFQKNLFFIYKAMEKRDYTDGGCGSFSRTHRSVCVLFRSKKTSAPSGRKSRNDHERNEMKE